MKDFWKPVGDWLVSDTRSQPGDPTPQGHFMSLMIMLMLCFILASCEDSSQTIGPQQHITEQTDYHSATQIVFDLPADLPSEVYQHDDICREFLPVMIGYMQKPAITPEQIWGDVCLLFEERYGLGTWPSQALIAEFFVQNQPDQLPGVHSKLQLIINQINGLSSDFFYALSDRGNLSSLQKAIDNCVRENRDKDLEYLYVLLSSLSLYQTNDDYTWFVDEFGEPGALNSIPNWALCDTAGAAIGGGAGAAAGTLGYFLGCWLSTF